MAMRQFPKFSTKYLWELPILKIIAAFEKLTFCSTYFTNQETALVTRLRGRFSEDVKGVKPLGPLLAHTLLRVPEAS